MKRNFKHSSSIERYLSDEMAYAEKKSFEKEIVVNPELAAEYQLTLNIEDAIRQDDILDFRKKLLMARKESLQKKTATPPVKMVHYRFWYFAATILILLSVGGFWYFSESDNSSGELLFRKYYSAQSMIDITRSGDANIVEAIIKYQEKDFKSAAILFSQILHRDSGNYAGWFYYGITCIETSQFNEAEDAFNKIINNGSNLYIEHAHWYLGLAYLKSNQMNKARAKLEQIANDGENFHRRDAKHLLDKLSE